MSEQKKPQAGEWWQHNMHGRVLIVGFDDEDPVFKFALRDGWRYECQLLRCFTAVATHLPASTGWCWKEPEPVTVKRVFLDLWVAAELIELRSATRRLFVTARDTCPSPVSRFIRVQYDDVAGFYLEVPNNSGEGVTWRS